MECGTQELDVCFRLRDSEIESMSFFSSNTLTSLKLGGDLCFDDHDPFGAAWLPALKFLHLQMEDYSYEPLVPSLLSCSPALEELVIDGERRGDVMEIRATKLKKLCSTIRWTWGRQRSEIDAPSLEYLSLIELNAVDYVINKLDNLIEAHLFITMEQSNIGGLFDLLRGVCNVKHLYFSIFFEEQAATTNNLQSSDHHSLPEFSNLVRLCFGEYSDLHLLPSFLQKSSKLELLIIERHDLVDAFWTEPPEVPACLSSSLSHFTYKGFLGKKEEIEIVEYLIRNSRVLKTLTIQPSFSFQMKDRKEKIQIYLELARLSEVSKSCKFRFEQKSFHPDEEEYGVNVRIVDERLNERHISGKMVKRGSI